MKLKYINDHHNGESIWKELDLFEWVTDIFEVPNINVEQKCTVAIRSHVQNEFLKEGWALDVRIDQDLGLTVFAMKDDLAFQLQTGNISRVPYDLLKLQYLYSAKKIKAAAIALPSKDGANKIGSNIANLERVYNELQLFDRVITVPILLIAFD